MTTLLALFRRPDGGPEATRSVRAGATPRRTCRSSSETPGLRAIRVHRVGRRSAARPTCVLATEMDFDDRPRSTPASPRTRCGPPGGTCARSPRAWSTLLSSRMRRTLVRRGLALGRYWRACRPTRRSASRFRLPLAVRRRASRRAGVALVTIDRPEALNALSFALLAELVAALEPLDAEPACRAIVLTGAGTRAFAAGADIKELAGADARLARRRRPFAAWDDLRRIGLPIIAAVRGFALGGGCELAMACDLIVAGEDAQFGQPEIKLGVIPGRVARSA